MLVNTWAAANSWDAVEVQSVTGTGSFQASPAILAGESVPALTIVNTWGAINTWSASSAEPQLVTGTASFQASPAALNGGVVLFEEANPWHNGQWFQAPWHVGIWYRSAEPQQLVTGVGAFQAQPSSIAAVGTSQQFVTGTAAFVASPSRMRSGRRGMSPAMRHFKMFH